MSNHEDGHSRPQYLALKDNGILWFVPLSSKVFKYEKIIQKKVSKYGICKTIMIKHIAGKKQAILIQNAFPSLEKYVSHIHMIDGIVARIPDSVQKEIINNLQYVFSLKEEGINLFFADIDRIKVMMLEETEKELTTTT